MKQFINRIANNRLVKSSVVVFLGSVIASIGNYLYHLILARMLSVTAYGELESLIALFYIISVPASALMVVMTKYTAQYKAQNNYSKIFTFFTSATKKIIIAGMIIFIVFILFSGKIADFLQLDSWLPIVILGVCFVATLLTSYGRGVLNGLQKFSSTSINVIIEVMFKLILAVIFVYFSFGVNGAVGALSLAGFIAYLFVFKPLRFLFKNHEKAVINYNDIGKYFFPVFFTMLFLTLMYNIDVLLIKHFFEPELAGQYGALTVLGRIIFFVALTISTVIFPMAAEAHAKKENHQKILTQGFILTVCVGLMGLLFYFLLPELIIKILIGSKFLVIKHYLGWFALAMLLYSIVYLLIQYFLSIGKTKCWYIVGVSVVMQVTMITIWHSSIGRVVLIMNLVMVFSLIMLFVFYCKVAVKNEIPESEAGERE